MNRREDEQLPDDLEAVEQMLAAVRPDLNPIEADELQQRVARQVEAARGGRPARSTRRRRKSVAVALMGGLMLTSGASAVLATTATTGGSTSSFTTWNHPPGSGNCQYHPSWTKTFTFTKNGVTITIKVSYDCTTGKFTVTITCSKAITYYYCKGKKVTVPGGTKTTTFVLEGGLQSVSVTSGGVTNTFLLPLIP